MTNPSQTTKYTIMSNIPTVQQIYAAFGRGDVPTILELLSESVEWEYGICSTDVPWLQPRRGRAAVGGFFMVLGAVEFHSFQVKTILEGDNLVVALTDIEVTVKETGQRIVEVDEPHIWHFDEQGLVSRFRHRVDTHQHWLAYTGVEVPENV
jgi:hypothetical protein